MNKLLLLTMGVLSCGALARADAPVVAPLTVPEATADASALWAGVTGGKMTATQAWQDDLLDSDTVQTGLAQGVASGQSDNAMQLRRELGGLLANNAPAVAAIGAQLPANVQLALADYYASVGDERAAPLYEAVIVGTKAPYEKALHLLALGKFWSQIGQPQKSEEVFGRGRAVLLAQGKNPHLAAEMLLMTARAWSKSGATANARQFYDKTVADGDGWMSGMALWIQANDLIGQGKDEAAQKLLQQPVTGSGADQVKVGMLSLLSTSYFRTGNLVQAHSTSQQAIEQYKALASSSQGQGLENQLATAEQVLLWSGHWLQEPIPIVCDPPSLQMKLPQWTATGHSRTWPMSIRSRNQTTVTVTSDNAQVKVRFTDDEPFYDAGYFWEKGIEVEVSMGDLQKSVDATLSIRSPQFPDAVIQVPIHIEVEKLNWD